MVFARTTITECLICSGRKKRPGVRVKVNEGDLDYCGGCISRLYAVLPAPSALRTGRSSSSQRHRRRDQEGLEEAAEPGRRLHECDARHERC